jgi:hypothetical protein
MKRAQHHTEIHMIYNLSPKFFGFSFFSFFSKKIGRKVVNRVYFCVVSCSFPRCCVGLMHKTTLFLLSPSIIFGAADVEEFSGKNQSFSNLEVCTFSRKRRFITPFLVPSFIAITVMKRGVSKVCCL